jgi:two-component system, NarL family, invasion response regulator UvrY
MKQMIRILIADDHAVVRKGLKQIITDEFPSAEITEVGDVESLIVQVIKADWDVIICDISMPGRSGVEALEQVKQIKPDIPVLMLSMHSEDQYAMRVLKAGASGFLNKASVHEELIKAIHIVRLGRKYITPSIAERLAESLTANDGKKPHEILSNREFEILKMIASGRSISEIADQLSLSPTTVSTYRSRILEKMSLKSNADITRYALENGLI